MNNAGKKPQEIPLREATGSIKSPVPIKMMAAKPTAMIWVALSRNRRFLTTVFRIFLWSDMLIPFFNGYSHRYYYYNSFVHLCNQEMCGAIRRCRTVSIHIFHKNSTAFLVL